MGREESGGVGMEWGREWGRVGRGERGREGDSEPLQIGIVVEVKEKKKGKEGKSEKQ